MTGLIKDIVTFGKYVRIANTMQYTSLQPYLVPAQEKFLLPYMGESLLNALDAWYNTTNPQTNAAYTSLLPYAQTAVANFSMALAAPQLDLVITESGFAVISNQNLAPASAQRVQNLVESLTSLGWDGIENMLRFLEKYRANYSAWTSSQAYTIYSNSIIRSANEFDACVHINQSRLTFTRLKPLMDQVELLQIKPVISPVMFADVCAKQIQNNLGAYAAFLPQLKRAIANFTWFLHTKDTAFQIAGNAFLGEVKNIIDSNINSYPLYAASPQYDAAKTGYRMFENAEENQIFNMGF